jgi:hypothetical protein
MIVKTVAGIPIAMAIISDLPNPPPPPALIVPADVAEGFGDDVMV